MRVICIGAHPDDCEIEFGGTAAKLAARGDAVKFISVTNGEAGHHLHPGPELVARRRREAEEAAQRLGIAATEILENRDGQLLPSIAARKEIVRQIRAWGADMVVTHRPWDYHPDHRYTGQLVQDSAYLVKVPYVCPDIPALRRNPVFLHLEDAFQMPVPFAADIAVDIDDVWQRKLDALDAHRSQVYEWLPWVGEETSEATEGKLVPNDEVARREWLDAMWSREPSVCTRAALARRYGRSDSAIVRHAEGFALSEYGRHPSPEELDEMFPVTGMSGMIDMSKMLQETRDQPDALSRTMDGRIDSLEGLRSHFRKRPPRLIVLVARGTSDNAAQFGRYLIEITTRIPVSLAAPSILTLYGCPVALHDVVMIGISQSGESTDTNAVLEDARKQGATTIGITNNAASAMVGIVEFPLLIEAGVEISVAATKTCQLLALYLVAYALNGGIDLEQLRKIPEWVRGVLELEEDIEALVERYFFMSRAVTVGRGLNYANALEFGLKLMETCYVVAERFSAADLMHGPIALVERSFPVFVFAPAGVTWPSMAGVLDRLQELKAETLVITDPRNTEARGKAARLIEIPNAPGAGEPPQDLYTPIPYIVPAQLFAGHLAALKGLNPDLPRTLNKITRTM